MKKVKFVKPAYLPVGAVISLNREELSRRFEQVTPVPNRKGWYEVKHQTGFSVGMEARLQDVPPELVASGSIEEIRNVDA